MTPKQQLDDLIKNLDPYKWPGLSEEEKINLLQEFENIMAKIQNRPAHPVEVMSEEEIKADPTINGYFSKKEEVIRINPGYLKKRLGIAGLDNRFSFPNLIALIAHEGRHAWQHYVVDNPQLELVDPKTRFAIKMNFEHYQGNGSRYGAQLIELDARRFTREVMGYICKTLENADKECLEFEEAIEYLEREEMGWCNTLLGEWNDDWGNFLDFDEMIRKKMGEENPGVDYSAISIFEDVLRLILTGDFDSYINGPSIAIKGKRWFDKIPNEKVDVFKPEKIDKKKLKFM